jgi:hypothetical protein
MNALPVHSCGNDRLGIYFFLLPTANCQLPTAYYSSHIAQRHCLPQAVERVAGGNELLADVALVADF